MRRPLIVGNWKMNKTINEAVTLVKEIISFVQDSKSEVVLCPTAVCLSEVVKNTEGTNVKVGAQNMHYEESGAFTGEISVNSLKEIGIEYIILGHSERRQYFKETNEDINKKIVVALKKGMKPIICVGETLEERESGNAFNVIKIQLSDCLIGLHDLNLYEIVIAYEPIWAIGTGKTATKEDANEVIAYIRELLKNIFGNDVADKIRILYGGSVKASNIKELMDMSDIDGALVGGASLVASEFSKIVNY